MHELLSLGTFWSQSSLGLSYCDLSLGTHRLHSPSDFQQTAIQPLGANPITLGLPLEEANFRFRLPSRVLLAVYSPTVYSPTREWSWS